MRDLWAAHLWAGPASAISHRSAGTLWKLEGFGPDVVEVTIPRVRITEAVVVHRKRLHHKDVRMIDGLRVTSPSRTLLDLGDVVRRRRLERALDDALHRGLTTLAQLSELLRRAGGQGVRGTVVLRESIEARDPDFVRLESTLERRLARVIREAHLPRPIPQHEIFDETSFVARVDFAYPDARLVVEADGYRFHRDKEAWGRDLQRRTVLASLGWRVLHFTWDDVHTRPERVVDQIRRSLFGNGRSASD